MRPGAYVDRSGCEGDGGGGRMTRQGWCGGMDSGDGVTDLAMSDVGDGGTTAKSSFFLLSS